MSIAITEAFTTIAEVERQFQISRTENPAFFPEWQEPLPELSNEEQAELAVMRQRYLYQRTEGHLLEGTVLLLFVSPLLTLAGFYDPPFKVRAEESVTLTLTDSEEALSGRLDVLVLTEQVWVVVLESKKTALSVWSALPQTLAYLMANPNITSPSFALMTNGDESVFVKLNRNDTAPTEPQYGLSRSFAALTSLTELASVLQILKRMGGAIAPTP